MNLRKSAVFCENLRFGFSLSPWFRPLKRSRRVVLGRPDSYQKVAMKQKFGESLLTESLTLYPQEMQLESGQTAVATDNLGTTFANGNIERRGFHNRRGRLPNLGSSLTDPHSSETRPPCDLLWALKTASKPKTENHMDKSHT